MNWNRDAHVRRQTAGGGFANQAERFDSPVEDGEHFSGPSWTCCGCLGSVSAELDACWNCGTSIDGVADDSFRHADAYEPDVPKRQNQFGIYFLVSLCTAVAAIISFANSPNLLTGPIAVVGLAWILMQAMAWLFTERLSAWQRQHRSRRDR